MANKIVIKFLKLGTLLFFALTAFSAEVNFASVQKISENTLKNINLTTQYRDSNIHLEQIHRQLKTDQTKIKYCLNSEQDVINELKSNQFILEIKTNLPSLKNQQDEFQNKWYQNQERQQFCRFLQNQIYHTELKVNMQMYENSRKNLFKRQTNIIQVLKGDIDFHWFHFPRDLLQHSNLPQSLNFILRIMIVFSILGLIGRYVKNFKLSFSLRFSTILYITGIFLVIDPYFYLLLATIFTHNFRLPLVLLSLSALRILFIVAFYDMVRHIESKQILKDVVMMFISFSGYLLLVLIVGQISTYELSQPSPFVSNTILFWKYVFLICLPISTMTYYYFLRYRIMESLSVKKLGTRIFRCIFIENSRIFFVVYGSLLLSGLSGYINFAVTIWLMIMTISVLLLWLVIAKHSFQDGVLYLENASTRIGKLVLHYLFTSKDQTFFEIRIMKYLILSGTSLAIFFFIWIMCFLPGKPFFWLYNLFFLSQKAFDTHLTLINVLTALGVCLLLNIVNRFFSIYLARKVSVTSESFEKYRSIFYIMGLIIIGFVFINIAQLEFQSLGFILGGLSFGLGIGLRDLIGNFIAGLVLMFANPIAKGHYVVVGDSRGFVKKITLMEMQIETFDKVTVTLPNLKVLQSSVQNYSSSKHLPPRFHFKFVFTNITDLKAYEKTILEIMAQEKDVILTGPFAPTFLVLPGSNPSNLKEIELDLSFSVHHFEHLWQVISSLTENLIMAFKDTEPPVYLKASGLPQK
jgi:small-conductance mechanosensitive channel